MPDHQTIYAAHADDFEALIRREDYHANLLPALRAIYPLDGNDSHSGMHRHLVADEMKPKYLL